MPWQPCQRVGTRACMGHQPAQAHSACLEAHCAGSMAFNIQALWKLSMTPPRRAGSKGSRAAVGDCEPRLPQALHAEHAAPLGEGEQLCRERVHRPHGAGRAGEQSAWPRHCSPLRLQSGLRAHWLPLLLPKHLHRELQAHRSAMPRLLCMSLCGCTVTGGCRPLS